jgi:hypothetical protein
MLSETSVVQVPVPDGDAPAGAPLGAATIKAWSPIEVPRARRPTPTTLVVLASCAGVGAIVLGALAGVSTLSGSDTPPSAIVPVTENTPPAEQRVLALLAKPSTERIVFRGSGGRLLLAVGSGGRAAILIRGLERTAPGQPYYAWVVGSGRPVRAARFDGTERAVFLTLPLRSHESVVVASTRPTSIRPESQLVALRG